MTGSEMTEADRIRTFYQSLCSFDPITFPKDGGVRSPDAQGVYVIYNPIGGVDHVGRTNGGKKGLRQRLTNHLHGRSSYVILFLNGDGSRLRGRYRYRLVKIEDDRLRALTEAYAIGVLCPAHIGFRTTKEENVDKGG